MSINWRSLRDTRFVQLYDDYKHACALYEKAMTEYTFFKDSQWQDKAKLAKERLGITKEVMKDAGKEFIGFARMNKI